MATEILEPITAPASEARAAAKQTKEKPDAPIHNPYLAARKEWDERYGDLISRARNWRAAAFLFGAIALVSVAGMIVIAKQAKVVPYVVAVDNLGRVASAGMAEQTTAADDRLKRAVVYQWVSDWRMVTIDGIGQRKAIDRVYSMIGNGTPAQTIISEYYSKDPPHVRAQTQTVDVDVKAVFATSDKTYEVEWTETTRSLTGQVKSEERWKGSLTIAINPPSDERLIRVNPLGVYVTNASWSKVL
ncbi:MAG: VirB8/TrbF family protein [Acidobacteria bacterium]|nr:VirB8/TrbF family protein [Acidobacteriota bacterium]